MTSSEVTRCDWARGRRGWRGGVSRTTSAPSPRATGSGRTAGARRHRDRGGSQTPAPDPGAKVRTTWRYGEGYFQHRGRDLWHEYKTLEHRSYSFKEMGRCDDYVGLFDARRKVRLRLYDKQCRIHIRDDTVWEDKYAGAWDK
jgi:hypothetical protein